MTNSSTQDAESTLSQVRLRLLDPLGRAIEGLKYEIRQGTKTIAQGVTDAEGRLHQFTSEVGTALSVHVEHFVSGAMTQVREITPWTENFSVKLVSSKVKEKTKLAEDKGGAGSYQRKTYVVCPGDSLDAIARRKGTTAKELADLNHLRLDGIIRPGQVLKLPTPKGAGAASASATQSSAPKPSAPAPVPASQSASGQAEPPTKPSTTVPPAAANPTITPPATPVNSDRGENGTPKTTMSLVCQNACIKLGDKGPLIEELNIRLTGFGGTVSAPSLLNEFTAKTAAAVRQFQRDYMGTPETGKVCGALLVALDDFRAKYAVDVASMRCPCGRCDGFGSGFADSANAGIFLDAKHTKARPGTEYPGLHRALLWAFRAARFYAEEKDKDLGYSFLKVSSGYRCWYNNAAHNRHTTNHMGNALDLQFKKAGASDRCAGVDVDKIRSEIFVKRLGAQMRWDKTNFLSLESATDGATSWVHVDVRMYDDSYKLARYYAVNQVVADGDSMVEMAKREGRLPLIGCGGLPAPSAASEGNASAVAETRSPVASLKLSKDGLAFIKGWEKCSLTPYDDSEGFCTIGWGRLIAKKSCSSLSKDEMEPFKDGVTQTVADENLAKDVERHENIVKEYVQVSLFQHEYDALVSLIFNLGGFKKCPKLLSKLNTQDYGGCCDEFADITNGGTSGLVKRRQAEMNVFRNKVYNSDH